MKTITYVLALAVLVACQILYLPVGAAQEQQEAPSGEIYVPGPTAPVHEYDDENGNHVIDFSDHDPERDDTDVIEVPANENERDNRD